jgi:hypothetical protein
MILSRLEIEHLRQAGKDNGRLICTYQDFAEYGIRRPSIAPAIRLTVQLGFVEITQHGWRAAGYGRPTHYRLTYLPANSAEPTDEWANWASKEKNSGTKTCPEARYENVPGAGYGNVATVTPKTRVRKRSYILDTIHLVGPRGPGDDAPHSTPACGDDDLIPDFLTWARQNRPADSPISAPVEA